jgi:hypothetical protein
MIRFLTILVLAVLVVPAAAQGQSASDLLSQGIRAYTTREYDGGAWLLRRALSIQGAEGLSRTDAAKALMYLTATELARSQKDSAMAAARRLNVIDPKYDPDERVFSAQAIAVYQEARRSAPTMTVRAIGDTAIRPGSDAFTVRLVAASGPEVSAAITSADGRVVRTLYQGRVRDSVDIRWNGLDQSGNPPPDGRYAVTITPTARERRGGVGAAWILRLPLEVARPPIDTIPLPPEPSDSLLRPERGNYQGAWKSLAPGLIAGAAVIVLPKIVANGERPTNARLVVGATVTVAGIAAFLSHRPGRSLPANTQYNRTLREKWNRDVADITRRNAERLRQSRLVINAGAPVLTTSESP